MEIKAKKSLGQNFLKSESALNTIIEAGEVSSDDLILEIGPGQGALTEKILGTGAKVLAIEKDTDLIDFLNNKFSEYIQSGHLILKNIDILEFDESEISSDYKLIANIPYYITGAIIRKFLSSDNQPNSAVLLVQKEVADRIISSPEKLGSDKHPKNKENMLSVSVKVYGEPQYIKTVPAGSFVPAPKVDSAIIKIQNINKNNFLNIKEEEFFELLHVSFAHKRKTLLKNLSKTLKEKGIDKKDIIKFLKHINQEEKVRAEDLSTQNFIDLVKIVFN
jgi:16S rRNA (adenine1518-N6/adenine1519-N6)-dimethyltransferase